MCNNQRTYEIFGGNDTIDENKMKFCDVQMGVVTVTKADKNHNYELKRYVMFALRFLL